MHVYRSDEKDLYLKRKIMASKIKTPTEHQIQSAFFDLVRAHYPRCKLIYANPSGAKRQPALASWLKREGLIAGVPDVSIDIPNSEYCGMRIEFKSATGRLSEEQEKTINQLRGVGYYVEIHRDAETAFADLQFYLQRSSAFRTVFQIQTPRLALCK